MVHAIKGNLLYIKFEGIMDIFKVLDEFELDDPLNRVEKIINLTEKDITALLDTLEIVNIDKEKIQSSKNENHSWELWLPFSSDETLEQIPGYCLAFDKVYINDPLYDMFCELDGFCQDISPSLIEKVKQSLPLSMRDEIIDVFDDSKENFLSYFLNRKEFVARKIEKIISYIIKHKELIEEEILIPYIDNEPGRANAFELLHRYGKELTTNHIIKVLKLSNPIQWWDQLVSRDLKSEWARKMAEEEITYGLLDYVYEAAPHLITLLDFKDKYPSGSYPHITLGDEKNKQLLNHAVDILIQSKWGLEMDAINWAEDQDEILYPSLLGVPNSEILNVREKEKGAFDKFKYYLQKNLVEMKAVAGTKDYRKLVASFQIEQQAQVSEIGIIYNNLKKNLQRNLTHHISSIMLSASATILSAMATTTDPLALLGVGVGSSGTALGVDKIIEDWISFQTDVDKLREKDCYVLWRINQSQHKQP